MNERIGKAEIAQMFVQAAKNLRSQHARLSELDSVAGDGDHGTTMLRVAERLECAIDPASPKNLQAILRETGWTVLGVDGGASSAILGTFFAGMADAAMGDDSMDCHELAEAFQSGLYAVSRRTRAQPGDKTMMDALVPAVDALHSADSAKERQSSCYGAGGWLPPVIGQSRTEWTYARTEGERRLRTIR